MNRLVPFAFRVSGRTFSTNRFGYDALVIPNRLDLLVYGGVSTQSHTVTGPTDYYCSFFSLAISPAETASLRLSTCQPRSTTRCQLS